MLIALNSLLTGLCQVEQRVQTRKKEKMPHIYPFTAIVGQERMKRALVLNAVDPRIGGVLIRGERGTAKSTAARAMAALLPQIEVYSRLALQ